MVWALLVRLQPAPTNASDLSRAGVTLGNWSEVLVFAAEVATAPTGTEGSTPRTTDAPRRPFWLLPKRLVRVHAFLDAVTSAAVMKWPTNNTVLLADAATAPIVNHPVGAATLTAPVLATQLQTSTTRSLTRNPPDGAVNVPVAGDLVAENPPLLGFDATTEGAVTVTLASRLRSRPRSNRSSCRPDRRTSTYRRPWSQAA